MTNRIPFDLERFLAGDEAVCRDENIEVVDFKYWKNIKDKKKLQLYLKAKNAESAYTLIYDDRGRFDTKDSDYDLFMKPRKKTLWIAVAKDQSYIGRYDSVGAFADKDELIRIIRDWPNLSNYSIISAEIEV